VTAEELAGYRRRFGHPAGTVTGGNPGHPAAHRILNRSWDGLTHGGSGVVDDDDEGRWTFEEIHAHHLRLHRSTQPHPVWCWAPIGVEPR
jgi:hypothetical protein